MIISSVPRDKDHHSNSHFLCITPLETDGAKKQMGKEQ